MLDDSQWSHKAWMSQLDANLLERVVMRKAHAADGQFRVLEWGAGRSTLYFTDLLRAQGISHHWLSLEYDRDFFQATLARALAERAPQQAVTIRLDGEPEAPAHPTGDLLECVVFDAGKLTPYLEGHEADRQANLDAYVDYPVARGLKFDFILVDGRKRRRCLLTAAQCLRPNGVVVLHDAYRTYYQCAFERFFAHRMFGEILWIGSQAQTNFLEWIV
jgi:predicted O-methyltransferase YrrM